MLRYGLISCRDVMFSQLETVRPAAKLLIDYPSQNTRHLLHPLAPCAVSGSCIASEVVGKLSSYIINYINNTFCILVTQTSCMFPSEITPRPYC